MENGVMMQVFHWDSAADGQFYNRLADLASRLNKLGITAVWMPPAAKGTSDRDVGYSSYDYWDLGEFDQKGTVRTKYGTKEEYEHCIQALHEAQIQVYADMVLNHKGGADETETFMAVKVDPNDRTKELGEAHNIEAWTKFTFPGRQGKYSDFVWTFNHFTGVDFDQKANESGIFRILGEGKYWNDETDAEKGNFDYLMNADIDHDHPEVREELTKVADFMIQLGVDGFRYDALKHISRDFIDTLSNHIKETHPDFYFVGEYWNNNRGVMDHYLNETEYQVNLFDVPLHFNFYAASRNPDFDIRKIFDGCLVKEHPELAVTFVDNHDSQPGQALESWVDNWFKEIAYALILFREAGYPCIFRGDFDGIQGIGYPGLGDQLQRMILIRKLLAYGPQGDYWVTPTKIGWTRRGDEEHPNPLVVLLSTRDMDQEKMMVGERFAGKEFYDLSGKNDPVTIDGEGYGEFTVAPGSVTYWTSEAGKDLVEEAWQQVLSRRKDQ